MLVYRFFLTSLFLAAYAWHPLLLADPAQPLKVEVFHVGEMPSANSRENPPASYHRLDKAELLQNEINKRLPSELNSASDYMSDYANSEQGRAVIAEMVNGYQGVGRAFSLGVERLPAVVINESFVVYGTTDVDHALQLWALYLRDGGSL